MNEKMRPGTVILLLVPPILWASNAVLGRAVVGLVPPMTLNFLRWALALLILLPLGHQVLRRNSAIWRQWPRYAMLGLLGVGLYNSLQYLALHTSTPVNITLVASSLPVWMLLIGRFFHGVPILMGQLLGAVLSLLGVALVLSHGQWSQLMTLHFVSGDLLMVLATLLWAVYSWELTRVPPDAPERAHWAGFLLAQVLYGVLWSGLFAGLEWTLAEPVMVWGWPLILTVIFVAIGPAIMAFWCWGSGVARVGPTVAGFFFNLTPLIAAGLSLLLLGDSPHLYHGLAFLLIIGGIVLSSRRRA